MDPVVEKEIQSLIEQNLGDSARINFILECMKNGKKIYNSDKKYLTELLEKHCKEEDILERVGFVEPKPAQKPITQNKTSKPITHRDQKYCSICEKVVWPERNFSVGALLVLLMLGIIPGLIYYAVKNKTCPICKHDQWEVSPSEK